MNHLIDTTTHYHSGLNDRELVSPHLHDVLFAVAFVHGDELDVVAPPGLSEELDHQVDDLLFAALDLRDFLLRRLLLHLFTLSHHPDHELLLDLHFLFPFHLSPLLFPLCLYFLLLLLFQLRILGRLWLLLFLLLPLNSLFVNAL